MRVLQGTFKMSTWNKDQNDWFFFFYYTIIQLYIITELITNYY